MFSQIGKELNALMAEIMESAQPEFNDGDDEEEEETEVPEPPARCVFSIFISLKFDFSNIILVIKVI